MLKYFVKSPILRKDIIYNLSEKFIELCSKNNCQYSAAIITNGWYLNRDTAEKLYEYKVGTVQVTIDGPSEVHDTRRPLKNGSGTFDRIINNITETADTIRIIIRVNVDKTNSNQVLKVFQILQAKQLLDKVYVYFGHVHAQTEACTDIQSTCYNTEDFAGVELGLYQMLNANDISVSIPYPRYLPNFCGAVSLNSYVIDPLGRLCKCWHHIGNEQEIVGNIQQIENLDHRVVKWLDIQPFDNEECCECAILPLCSGGCPEYYHKGNYEQTNQPNCVTWRSNSNYEV